MQLKSDVYEQNADRQPLPLMLRSGLPTQSDASGDGRLGTVKMFTDVCGVTAN